MIYDLFSFNGEYDMLEIRFNLLSPLVDKFVIVESAETFSDLPKPLYWIERDQDRFEEWEDKVIYVVSEFGKDQEIMDMMKGRPYVDQPAFQRAFYQKESLRHGLKDAQPEDIIYYGDVDEVWKPKQPDEKVHKLRQIAYSYYLNNRSPEDWRGTIVTKFRNMGSLNDMRANPIESDIWEDGGWHWTNLGGAKKVKEKIEAYDHQEVNIPWVKDGLEERITLNVDALGRGWQFWIDESQLPKYILDNKKYFKERGLWKS